MTPIRTLLALGVTAAVLGMAGCKKEPTPTTSAASTAPAGETADQFIARVNAEYLAMYPELTAAQWLSSTYINDDSQLLSAKANERYLTQLNSWIEQARQFEGKPMSPETARAIQLLKLANLSALGFNALSEEDIRPYRDDFEKGATEFAEGFKTLETLAQADPQRAALVADIKSNYETYTVAVRKMFDAKPCSKLSG